MTMAKKKAGKKPAARKKPAAKKKTSKKAAAKKTATVKKTRPAGKKKTTKKTTSKKTNKKAAKKKVAKKTGRKKTVKKKPATRKAASATKKKTTAAKTTGREKAAKKAAKKSPARSSGKPAAKQKVIKARREPTDVQPFTPYQAEEYMNSEQVAHFREILNGWKRALMEEVDRTVHHMQDEAANFPDPNDRATQEEEFALELRTRDRERKLIRKIDEALLDLETGDYGYCEVCGIEIGIRRLEARPTATLCIDCKTLDEIKERQFG